MVEEVEGVEGVEAVEVAAEVVAGEVTATIIWRMVLTPVTLVDGTPRTK